MSRNSLYRYIAYFLLFVLLQLPLIYNWVLYETAFAFIYLGFILFLPLDLNRGWLLLIGFFTGLLVDTFTNTPGLHALVTVLIAYFRSYWVNFAVESADELEEINLSTVRFGGFLTYTLPLLFFHLFLLFVIQNEGFRGFGILISRITFSTLFSFFLIWMIMAFLTPRKRRL